MPETKKISKPDISLTFLKWLVTLLSIIMVFGFLFLIIILGLKISDFNTIPKTFDETINADILIPEGQIETIDIEEKLLTMVVRVEKGYYKVLIVNLQDGKLLNQYSIKQKKKPL
jgi:hypothetical protein